MTIKAPARPGPQRHRVLYVDTAPTVGGSVISLCQLLRGLDRSRYEPYVVSYSPHSFVHKYRELGAQAMVKGEPAQDHRPAWVEEARGSLPLRLLQRTWLGSELYHGLGFAALLARRTAPRAWSLCQLIRQEEIELVHTNIRVGHDREGILAAKLAGVPCVAHVRDFEDLNWFDRRLSGMVSVFVYISQAVQECHRAAGVPSARGRVVYNAVDTSIIFNSRQIERERETLGLAPDTLAVGLVGRLEPWKGHRVFLRAMARVVAAVPEARGAVIGDPVPYEADYPGLLSDLVRELELDSVVGFYPFRPDAAAAMAGLDLVVLASSSPEPFGRVLIEAMALGKPVVATNAGATREIVQDGIQGLLVEAGNAEALAAAIIRLLTHREEARLMGQRGRERAEECFGLDRYVRSVETIYDELLA